MLVEYVAINLTNLSIEGVRKGHQIILVIRDGPNSCTAWNPHRITQVQVCVPDFDPQASFSAASTLSLMMLCQH